MDKSCLSLPVKKSVVALIGFLLIVASVMAISTLQTNPYVTDDGVYGAQISERMVLLEFIDNETLIIHTNPGKETYTYTIDNDKITLTDAYSGGVSIHSFQYIEDERVVILDNVEYNFYAELC